MGKVKILELCIYSAGICGVWNRVKEESLRLSEKGYEVKIFSSNAIKGSNNLASSTEKMKDIQIKRFPYTKLGGESFMYFNFKQEAIKYAPDIIIAHVYRHLHTTIALKIKKELKRKGKKCNVFLVTHAPFNEDDSSRGLIAHLAVKIYDKTLGRTINKFDKVITISNWEVPYLLNMGLDRKKIVYIPNGVPEIFFKCPQKNVKSNKILFLGRIAPVKNLEIAISGLTGVNNKYLLELVGPIENDYKEKLQKLAKEQSVSKRLIFSKPIYNLPEKIKKIDSCDFFILPSKREGMPQSLIEAMARGKISIGSNAEGIKEIIKNGINGFTLDGNSPESAKGVMRKVTSLDKTKINQISRNSRGAASKFKWNLIIDKLDKLIKSQLH